MPAYLLGALISMAAIVVFVFQNNTPVAVHFISWHSAEISLALVALIAAVGGALITFLIDSFRAFKTGRKLRELMNHNRKLEKEVLALKGQQTLAADNSSKTNSNTKAANQAELP